MKADWYRSYLHRYRLHIKIHHVSFDQHLPIWLDYPLTKCTDVLVSENFSLKKTESINPHFYYTHAHSLFFALVCYYVTYIEWQKKKRELLCQYHKWRTVGSHRNCVYEKALEQAVENKKRKEFLWQFYCYCCSSLFFLLVCLLIARPPFRLIIFFLVGFIELLSVFLSFFFLLVLFFSIAIDFFWLFFPSNARKMFIWSIWRLMSRILLRFTLIYPRYLRTIHTIPL